MDYKKFMDKLTEGSYQHGMPSPHGRLSQGKREDDEYHNGPDPVKHTYSFKVSKDGAEPHHRSVTTPMTRKSKHELEGLARAHLEKQGYKIHEGLDIIARADYKLDKAGKKSHKEIVFHNGSVDQEKDDKLKREEVELEEKLTPSMGAGAYIKDFQKSDAPQFKGKSKEKKRMMGIAAYMASKKAMKEEVEHLEETKVTVDTKKYSWGTMKTVHHGSSFSIPLHPEHHKEIAKLKDQQEHKFKTEDGKHWTAKRSGDDVHFQGANGGSSTKVKHSTMKEEVEIAEAAPFKTLDQAVAHATDKVKTHRDNLDGIEVYKHKSGGYDVNHTMNSSGRNSLASSGAKHLGTVYKDKPANIKEEAESHQSKTTMKHIPNASPALKKAAKDIKPGVSGYRDRIAMLKAGGVKEEVEVIDELSKSTLGSYAKKASRDAVITRKIGADFENKADKARSPGMKAASNELSQKYKSKSWKRRDGLDKAVDRLTKEETVAEAKDEQEYGYEGDMAMTQLETSIRHATYLKDMLKPDTDLPEWVQSKITLATDYLQTACDYMTSEMNEALKGNQHKIDKNKNGKVDAHDFKLLRKEEAIDEAMINGREYASHGLMHPTHAAHAVHKVTGNTVDFYAHGSGDKVSGKVIKNDGKAVHIKDTSGKTHKFQVTANLPKQQNEEIDFVDEQAPVAPVPDRKYIKGTPENKALKASRKPINGMPTKVKEGANFDEEGNLMAEKKTYSQFVEQLLEYESDKDGVYRHTKGSYGKSYDSEDDDKPKKAEPSTVKRGRGRPAGAKSGANQKVSSGKSYGGIATHTLNLPK
jgi:hypothetical protein